MLSQLSGINDEMAGYAAGAGEARSAAIHHTLQRHAEILQDYKQEFNKTSANKTKKQLDDEAVEDEFDESQRKQTPHAE